MTIFKTSGYVARIENMFPTLEWPCFLHKQIKWLMGPAPPTADAYFPAVTNISSQPPEKITVVALPTLRPAAELPQMASLLAMLHTTTLPNERNKRVRGRRAFKIRNSSFSSSRKKEKTGYLPRNKKIYTDLLSPSPSLPRHVLDHTGSEKTNKWHLTLFWRKMIMRLETSKCNNQVWCYDKDIFRHSRHKSLTPIYIM